MNYCSQVSFNIFSAETSLATWFTCLLIVVTRDGGASRDVSVSLISARKSNLVHSADLCRVRVMVRAVIDRYGMCCV